MTQHASPSGQRQQQRPNQSLTVNTSPVDTVDSRSGSGREYYSGKLSKKGQFRWQNRTFILRSDRIVYKRKDNEEPLDFEDRKPILLNQSTRVDAISTKKDFSFHVSTENVQVILAAQNEAEMRHWITAIQHRVEGLKPQVANAPAPMPSTQPRSASLAVGAAQTGMAVVIKLLEASNLMAMDSNGQSDPYIEFRIGKQKARSEVIKKTLNPKWNGAVFNLTSDGKDTVLYLTCFDHDIVGKNDFLGEAQIRLTELPMGTTIDQWIPLKNVSSGRVHIQLQVSEYTGKSGTKRPTRKPLRFEQYTDGMKQQLLRSRSTVPNPKVSRAVDCSAFKSATASTPRSSMDGKKKFAADGYSFFAASTFTHKAGTGGVQLADSHDGSVLRFDVGPKTSLFDEFTESTLQSIAERQARAHKKPNSSFSFLVSEPLPFTPDDNSGRSFEISSWSAWKASVRADDRRVALIVLRRRHVPPIGDHYQDIVFQCHSKREDPLQLLQSIVSTLQPEIVSLAFDTQRIDRELERLELTAGTFEWLRWMWDPKSQQPAPVTSEALALAERFVLNVGHVASPKTFPIPKEIIVNDPVDIAMELASRYSFVKPAANGAGAGAGAGAPASSNGKAADGKEAGKNGAPTESKTDAATGKGPATSTASGKQSRNGVESGDRNAEIRWRSNVARYLAWSLDGGIYRDLHFESLVDVSLDPDTPVERQKEIHHVIDYTAFIRATGRRWHRSSLVDKIADYGLLDEFEANDFVLDRLFRVNYMRGIIKERAPFDYVTFLVSVLRRSKSITVKLRAFDEFLLPDFAGDSMPVSRGKWVDRLVSENIIPDLIRMIDENNPLSTSAALLLCELSKSCPASHSSMLRCEFAEKVWKVVSWTDDKELLASTLKALAYCTETEDSRDQLRQGQSLLDALIRMGKEGPKIIAKSAEKTGGSNHARLLTYGIYESVVFTLGALAFMHEQTTNKLVKEGFIMTLVNLLQDPNIPMKMTSTVLWSTINFFDSQVAVDALLKCGAVRTTCKLLFASGMTEDMCEALTRCLSLLAEKAETHKDLLAFKIEEGMAKIPPSFYTGPVVISVRRIRNLLKLKEPSTQKEVAERIEPDVGTKATAQSSSVPSKHASVSFAASKPKLVISGAPLSGCSTQCQRLKSKFGLVHVSPTEVLKNAMVRGTAEGKEVHQYIDKKITIPDYLIARVLKLRLDESDCVSNGWVMENFPWTDGHAKALQKEGVTPSHLVVLEVPDNTLVERAKSRKFDPVTKETYDSTTKPPNEETTKRLKQKPEDREEQVRQRIVDYHKEIKEVMNKYPNSIVYVDGAAPTDQVTEQIAKQVNLKAAAPKK